MSKKVEVLGEGPEHNGTREDDTREENDFSTPHSKDDLTENERIILGRDAHKADDYPEPDFRKEGQDDINKHQEPVEEVFGKRVKISYIVNKKGRLTPNLYEIGKQIRQAFNIAILKDRRNRTINNVFYEDGIYRPGAREFCDRVAEEIFKGHATVNLKNELWQHVKDQGWEYYDKWISEGFMVLENGVIDLSKLVNKSDPLLPWDPKIHSLNKLNVNYVPGAIPHIWLNHLNFVMPDPTNQQAFKTFTGSFLVQIHTHIKRYWSFMV